MKKSLYFLTLLTIVNLLSCKTDDSIQFGKSTKNVSNPGTLHSLFTNIERDTITSLILTGTIDARDIKYIRDSLTMLKTLNMTSLNIAAYTGENGTLTSGYPISYIAKELPAGSFSSHKKFNETLEVVYLPNSITSIGNAAFYACSGIKSITIPNNVESIGTTTFSGCLALKSIVIPKNVTSIGGGCFSACPKLTSFAVDSLNKNYSSLDGVLCNKERTTLICCPGSMSGNYTIPNKIKTIWFSAFYMCGNLTSITIPESVTSIYSSAFEYCYNLTAIYSNQAVPVDLSSTSKVFNGIDKSNCILFVPVGSKIAYQESDGWKDFIDIRE